MHPPAVVWAYCDGSWVPATHVPSGIGIALWDSDGELLTLSRGVGGSLPPHYLEPLAILTALECAWEMGYRWMIVHCDCEHTVAQILGRAPDLPRVARLNRRVQRYTRRFQQVEFVCIDREQNQQAHDLARAGIQRVWTRVHWRGEEVAA